MKGRFLYPVIAALLPLLSAGCQHALVTRGGASVAAEQNSAQSAVVLPEKPAPLVAGGQTLFYNYDGEREGELPRIFHEALTGVGAPAKWRIVSDKSAPSAPNVLVQLSGDSTGYRFPLVINDEGSFKDLELSVKFKPVGGSVDRAAGLVWRLRDANNYYIVRANALENNVVPYIVEDGKRRDLPLRGIGVTYGKRVGVPAGEWSDLRVVAVGPLFEVYFDGEKLFEVEDQTFRDAGKVGLWTKADSVTYFDDFRVTAR